MGKYLHRESHSIFFQRNIVLVILNRIPLHPPTFASLLILVKNVEISNRQILKSRENICNSYGKASIFFIVEGNIQ